MGPDQIDGIGPFNIIKTYNDSSLPVNTIQTRPTLSTCGFVITCLLTNENATRNGNFAQFTPQVGHFNRRHLEVKMFRVLVTFLVPFRHNVTVVYMWESAKSPEVINLSSELSFLCWCVTVTLEQAV